MALYFDWIPKKWRYWGLNIEPGLDGNKMICFGFWFFHIYIDTGEKYGD